MDHDLTSVLRWSGVVSLDEYYTSIDCEANVVQSERHLDPDNNSVWD